MDRRRLIGIVLVVISACAFGSGGLFAAPVYAAGVGWMVLLAWRFLIGGALAWGWLLLSPERRRALRRLAPRQLAIAAGLGIVYVGNSGTYFAALETVPVSLAALIVYVYPAIVAVLSMRFARRLPGRRPWLALAVALGGTVLALGGIPAAATPPLAGLIQVVVSPVIYAAWIVLAARFSGERRSGEDAGGGADAVVATPIIMTATAAVYWAMAIATGRPVLPPVIPTAAWPGLLGVGIVSTAIAITTFYAGAQRIGAAQAALVSTIEPVWTIALAGLLLSQVLTPIQLAGGALVITGVLIAQTAPPEEQPKQLEVRLADE